MAFIWILAGLALLVFALDQLIERMYRYEKKTAQITPKKWVMPGKDHSDCDTHSQFWKKVGAFLQVTLPLSTQKNSFAEERT